MSQLRKSALLLTSLAITVKLAGFFREAVLAREFGANETTDGYLLAFSLITLMVAMLATGFSNVFLPRYVKDRKEDPVAAEKMASGVLNIIVSVIIVLSFIGILFVDRLIPMLFGSMDPVTEAVAVNTTRIFLIFAVIIAINAMFESYLQARRIFAPVQVWKLLSTLMAAVFALLFSDVWGIYSLAYGFIFGAGIGLIVQAAALFKGGFRWQPAISFNERSTFFIMLAPALMNSVVGQVNLFVDRIFATNTVGGAVTYLNNGSLLVSVPHTLYASTMAAIFFTLLSEQVNQRKQFEDTVQRAVMVTMVILMPISFGLLAIGQDAISFIFERGAFTAEDTLKTYQTLMFYSPIVVLQGIQYILSKSLYARRQTTLVLKISATTILLNAVANWFFVQWLGYPGLALASALISVYFVTTTSWFVYKDLTDRRYRDFWKEFMAVLVPAGLMGLSVFLIRQFVPWFDMIPSLMVILILAPVGAAIYFALMWIFQRNKVKRVISMVRRKRT
ncbi:murein biosynthesis integral membrane protein MurJ [Salisediminibacterium selenitireducens]|uniref:Virulence factor MVIN family protein n=1 Tax=Bacillus selenitireducens (strain ATCC 700615 / DSM 15326 / MLS10) TaxID=439292 RepID=D6Y0I2_BACIE|nr:oligosaccharide flippase family protein [Salisediminibacterium selenitireducens]ADI00550.1 virulence factor MVIN family protein [[Bacillus] selenitireducens MLS10]